VIFSGAVLHRSVHRGFVLHLGGTFQHVRKGEAL
jgi:hypothetical protein